VRGVRRNGEIKGGRFVVGIAYKGRVLEFAVELGWAGAGVREAMASRELIGRGCPCVCMSYL